MAAEWKVKPNTRIGRVFRLFAPGRGNYSAVPSKDMKTFIVARKSLSKDGLVSSHYRHELPVSVKQNLGETRQQTTIKKIRKYRQWDAMDR